MYQYPMDASSYITRGFQQGLLFMKTIKKNNILVMSSMNFRLLDYQAIISKEMYEVDSIIMRFILLYFNQNKFSVIIRTVE